MKHLKVTSVVLSIAICMSMFMPTVSVLADEAAAPSETQTEETEKQTPKETEKAKETEKPAAPKNTEKKETEPSEKKETEATEKTVPEETVKESAETQKPAPSETEDTTPAETEKQESESTETQMPAETEKQEPEETEKTEPEETETQVPEETEEEAPDATDKPVQESEDKKDAKFAQSGTCGNNLTFNLDNNGVLTISGTGNMNNSNPWQNYRDSVKTVVIGEGVTRISYAAFSNCKNLTKVTLPSTLITIEGSAFNYCTSLTSISIPSKVTTIESRAFCGSGLTSVNIPEGVKIIYDYVFSGTKISSITIPSTVTQICDYAFSECKNLTSITIPQNVNEIGACAFSECSKLTKATMNCTVLVNGKFGSGVFKNCTSLTSVTIPKCCELIEYFAFEGCTSLSQITIPDKVTAIQTGAFRGCTSLTSITIPSGVTNIDDSCFEGCVKLKSINIPSSADRIGERTFKGCTGLTSIYLPVSIEKIWLSAFSGCSALADVYYTGTETQWNNILIYSDNAPLINATLHSEGASSFNGGSGSCGDNLTWKLTTDGTLTISGSGAMNNFESTQLGTYSFYKAPWNDYKNKIKKVVFSGSITSIGNGAFNGCTALTSISLPSSITSVGINAFTDSGITSLTIPSGVTMIPDNAFAYCSNIKTLTLSGVKSVGQNAFLESGIQKVVFSSSLKTIGDYAFLDCADLKEVSFGSGLTSIGSGAFKNCTKLTGATLPDTLTSIGISAFSSTGITEITIPGNVYSLSGNSFYNCPNLASVTISSGVYEIGSDAFFGCENLTSVTIPFSVQLIGNAAFGGCDKLTDVYYGGNANNWDNICFDGSGHGQLWDANIHYGSSGVTKYLVKLGYNNGGGSVTFSPSAAAAGQTVTIVATPEEGYAFDHFDLDGTRKQGNTFTMPAANVEVDVYFKKTPYTITVTSSEGGTATCRYKTAGVGDLVEILTTPDSGYSVGSIKVNGEIIQGNTFTMPSQNTTVYVTFVKGGYPVNLSVGSNGTATVSKTLASAGDKITVTVSPSSGYVLDTIKVNGVALASGVMVFTMGAQETTVEVSFKKLTYPVTVSVPQGGTASANVTAAAPGDQVKITYSEADGYEFDKITLNGSEIARTTFTMPSGNAKVVVYFKKIQFNIKVTYSTGGTASCALKTAGVGDQVSITTTPETGYSVESIKVNGDVIEGSSFLMPARDTTVSVTFVKGGYPVNLSVGSNGTATVSKNVAGYGDTITVTANPATGYVLDKITVNGTALASGVTEFTMGAAAANVAVTFKKATYTVSVSVPQGGTASANVTAAGYGDTVKITYSAASGYALDKITLNGTAITGTAFTMPAENASVVVYFKKLAYTITVTGSTGGTASCTLTTASVGDKITINTTPETGYSVGSIKVNSAIIEGNTFEMPAQNTTVYVTFTKTVYNVNLTVGANGTATVSQTTANMGDKITVTAKPAIGYVLDAIKVNGRALASDVTEFTMGAGTASVVVSFKKAAYTVNVSVPSGGTARASATTAAYSDTIWITYTALSGYEFDKITVNGEAITGTTFYMPAEDAAVVVYFKKASYAVNLSVGENGKASVSKTSAEYGETVTVSVTPDAGYTLDTIKVNGTALAAGTMEFTMGTFAANVVVSFKKAQYSITVSVPQGGSAKTTPTSANAGDSVTVVPSPATGYELDKITLNGETISGTKFTMPAEDAVVVVFFKKIDYAVNLSVGENGAAKVSKNPANYGDEITVTATPSAGYVLDTIKVNGTALKAGVTSFKMGTSAANVVVTFKKAQYTISVSVPGGGGTASSKTTAAAGDLIELTCKPNTGYVIDKILVNNAAITGTTFTMPAKNTTVVVSFKKAVYSVSINKPVGGTASLSKTSAYYGDQITVTTKAATGYALDKIYVNGTALSSGAVFTMPAQDTEVEVTFKKIDYAITVTYGSNGTAKVSKNPANYGDKIVITATPSTGYTVDTIKVNGTVLSGTMEFTMGNAAATVEVSFKKAQYTISVSYPQGGGSASVVKMANEGDMVAIECTPNTGYTLEKIMVNGSAITGTSFKMPAQNTAVQVYFKKAVYTVSVNTPTGGTAKLSKTSAGYGEQITVTATPSTGYELDSITVNGRAIEVNAFIMPNENASVVVTFKKTEYKITVKQPVNGTAGVSKNPANYGDKITVTATPAEGYTLESIKVNGNVLSSGVTTFTMGTADATVEVSFKKIQYSITVKYSAGGTAYVDPKTAGIDDMVSVICKPASGYEVDKIQVNGVSSEESFLMPAKNTVVNVYFKKTDYDIVVAPDGNGTASVSKTPANIGDTITVTATPNPGYELDSIRVNGNPITGTSFKMEARWTTVEVYFKLKDLKVTVKPLTGGTAKADVTTAKMGDTVTITATPEAGYKLDYIMVNGRSQTSLTFKMGSEAAEVTVAFVKIPYTVKLTVGPNGTATVDKKTAVVGDVITVDAQPNDNYYAIIKVNGEDFGSNTFLMPASNVTINVTFDKVKPLDVGESAKVGSFTYTVTAAAPENGTGTVRLDKIEDDGTKAVVVPNTVDIKGVTYRVISIGNNALAGNRSMTALYIGAYVTVIGSKACYGCKALVKVSGGLRLKTIGNMAFGGCPKLATFVITSAVLAKISPYTFYADKSLKTIYVKNTSKLSKKGVKKSLKSSSVKTVKVKKSKVKKYKKYFTKKNCGKKVKVKK